MTSLNYPKKIRHCTVELIGQYDVASAKASWLQAAAHRVTPADLPMLAEHANKYAKQLARLAAAVAVGDENRAKCSVSKILRSFSAKLVCVLRGMGTDAAKTSSNCKMAITVASAISAWSCTEAVLVDVQPKSGGGVRYICSFGPQRRALQILCLDILKLCTALSSNDYAQKGRGVEMVADRLRELADVEHCTHFVLADIKDFFGSLKREAVVKMLPLPEGVVNNSLLIGREVKIIPHRNAISLSGNELRIVKEAVWRGIPQGSSASPYVASILLGPSLAALSAGQRVVRFGDDIAIGARDFKEATTIKEALEETMEKHPAGPLKLKRCEIANLKARFNFVKYRYGRRPDIFGGGFWCRPSPNSYRRFEEKVAMRVAASGENAKWHDVAIYMARWTKSFRRWKPNFTSYTMLYCTAAQGWMFGLAIAKTKNTPSPKPPAV